MGSTSNPATALAPGSAAGLRRRLRRFLQDLRQPFSRERRALCRRRWESLPATVRTAQQCAGRAHVACGATHGVLERCDFACSSCYLTPIANRTPPLSFERVRDQLDTLRRDLGPMGKVQITSGEVTLLEPAELGRIVAHARRIGLDPMVMTNGQRFSDDPDYLPTLVKTHGLRKVAVHVDQTQRGRRGSPTGAGEADLHPVRDHFAKLVRRTRLETGCPLDAAHTVTVTPRNIDQISAILAWGLENHDAFRMISFQPVAEIGRTRDRREPAVTLEAVWSRVREALGRSLNRDALHFGHPACNIVCPLFVVSIGERHEIVEPVPEGDARGLALVGPLLEACGGIAPLRTDLVRGTLRLASSLARNPRLVVAAAHYGLIRAWRERRLLRSIVAGLARVQPVRIRPWTLVVHNFMSRDELETPLGQERLASCVFRVPVDGRLVSMCELNATDLRLRLNEEQGRSCADPVTTHAPARVTAAAGVASSPRPA